MPPDSPPAWWRRALSQALASCDGNVSELERRTGIPRQTLQHWQAGTASPTIKKITPLMDYVDSLDGAAEAAPAYGVDEAAALAKIAKVLHDAGFDALPAQPKKRKP